MRSLLRLVIVLLICLVGIGLYRGWFSFSSSHPEATDNKVHVDVSVDKGKMKADIKEAKHKVKEEVRKLEGKTTKQPPAS
jgi:hypothetical protein